MPPTSRGRSQTPAERSARRLSLDQRQRRARGLAVQVVQAFGFQVGIAPQVPPILMATHKRHLFDGIAELEQARNALMAHVMEMQVRNALSATGEQERLADTLR